MVVQESYIRLQDGRTCLLFVRWIGDRRYYSRDGLRWSITPELATR